MSDSDDLKELRLDLAKLQGKVETLEFKTSSGDRGIEKQVDHILEEWKEIRALIEKLNERLDELANVAYRLNDVEKKVKTLENKAELQGNELTMFKGGKAVALLVGGAAWTFSLMIIQVYLTRG